MPVWFLKWNFSFTQGCLSFFIFYLLLCAAHNGPDQSRDGENLAVACSSGSKHFQVWLICAFNLIFLLILPVCFCLYLTAALHVVEFNFSNRAHQGFGWVGEWANSGSVIASLFLSLSFILACLYKLDQRKKRRRSCSIVVGWLLSSINCARLICNARSSSCFFSIPI